MGCLTRCVRALVRGRSHAQHVASATALRREVNGHSTVVESDDCVHIYTWPGLCRGPIRQNEVSQNGPKLGSRAHHNMKTSSA